jgi:hypothetical protein
MKLCGLMITKDDHAVFHDWCRDQLELYDAVVCLDGSTTDATARIARAWASRLIYLHESHYHLPHKTDHGLRRVVHQEIAQRFGRDNWIMCCHADEFCYHDPRKVALKAEQEGYDSVAWFSLHFFPHPDDLAAGSKRVACPVPEKWTHYHWSYQGSGLPWLEDRLYHNGPRVHWDKTTHGSAAPHHLERPAPFHPILQHYKVLTTDLNDYDADVSRTFYRTHWAGLQDRTGLPFAVARLEDLFVRSIPNYDCCDRFAGSFPQSWNMGEEYRPDRNRMPAIQHH